MKIEKIIEDIISEYGKRVTQSMWKKMSDDEKENALLTIFKDPDDRRFEDFLFSDWNKLPGWAKRDMRTEGKVNEADKLSGQGMWKDTKMFPITSKIKLKDLRNGAMIHFTGPSSGAKGETWKKQGNTMICLYGDGVKGKKLSVSDMQNKLKSYGRIQLNAGKEEKDVDLDKVFMKGRTKKRWTESTAQWEKTIKALAHQDALKKLKKGDKEKLLKIAQMLKKEKGLKEGVPFPQDAPNEFAYLDYKKWAYKYRGQYKKDIQKVGDNPSKIWATATKWWTEWAKRTGNKAYSNIKDSQKFGRELVKMMWKDNLIFDKSGHKITRLK